MSYTYSSYVTAVANMLPVPVNDGGFALALGDAIQYAENRIYRELNLLGTVIRDTSAALNPNNRYFALPSSVGRFVAVQGMNVITPSGTLLPAGTRQRLVPCWPKFLDFLYPSENATTTPSVPAFFYMLTDQQAVVGPPPDASYQMEVIGTFRPTPLGLGNTTTFLSFYLPDLFFAASMVFLAGYQKDFGAQSDDPRSAVSWEQQYQTLLASANAEELRKRYATEVSAMKVAA